MSNVVDIKTNKKSQLRLKLDGLSDAHADIAAASFFDKEKKISLFISELELFLNLLVSKIETIEAKNG